MARGEKCRGEKGRSSLAAESMRLREVGGNLKGTGLVRGKSVGWTLGK